MANETDRSATQIKGTDPQNLVEYITRQKIYDSLYWKQECFGLNAELLVDKGVALRYCGGMWGEPPKPSEFICLVLKMLQIQPEQAIVQEFITNDEFKYLRLLGAFYMRLTGRAVDVYQFLEPLLNDYRRVRLRLPNGNFVLSHIDELIDEMLRKDYMFNITLPRLPDRKVLTSIGDVEPRVSILQDEFEQLVKERVLEEARQKAIDAAAAVADNDNDDDREDGEMRGDRGHRRSKSPWRLCNDEQNTKKRKKELNVDRAGNDEIAEANALRASLGLAPLW